MIDVLLPLISMLSIAFAAGFGGGYLVRHNISRQRHREAARLHGYGAFHR